MQRISQGKLKNSAGAARLAGLDFTALFLAHNRRADGELDIEPADKLHVSKIAGQDRCELGGRREDRIRDLYDIVGQLDWMAGECPAASVRDEDAASEGLDAMADCDSGKAVYDDKWRSGADTKLDGRFRCKTDFR